MGVGSSPRIKGYAPRQACNEGNDDPQISPHVSKGYAPRQACNEAAATPSTPKPSRRLKGLCAQAGLQRWSPSGRVPPPPVSKGYAPRQACNSGARKPLAHKGSRRPPR